VAEGQGAAVSHLGSNRRMGRANKNVSFRVFMAKPFIPPGRTAPDGFRKKARKERAFCSTHPYEVRVVDMAPMWVVPLAEGVTICY
jgi:hypothetical protein